MRDATLHRILRDRLRGARRYYVVAILTGGLAISATEATTQTPAGPSAQTALTPAVSEEVTPRGDAHAHLRAGDAAFGRGDLDRAELEYRRAADREPGYRAYYNLGVTLGRLGRHAEAAEAFGRARRYADEEPRTADASYNAGVALASQEEEQLREAVAAYVDALRADPDDQDAKRNLSEVLRRLRRMQASQPPPQQGEGDPEQGEQQEDESADGGDGEQQPGDPSEEGGENSETSNADEDQQAGDPDGEPGDDPSEPSGAAGEPGDLAREEAERLLEVARDLERATQERIRRGEASRKKPEKDW